MSEGVSFVDDYYLDYKNVDKIVIKLDGSMTITYFNKRDRGIKEGNSLTLSKEMINGWKNQLTNHVTKETISN